MRKWLWIGGLVGFFTFGLGISLSFAVNPGVWRSSYTATADTTQNLCVNSKGILHGVCISSATAGASTFTVYADSAAANNIITVLDGTKQGCFYYDVWASTATGMSYSNSSTAKVTILYTCY